MGSRKIVSAIVLTLVAGLALSSAAQVQSVTKVRDPEAQLMQRQYASQLQQLGADAAALHFPYPFYFSDTLDIDEARQKQLPQGSVRFDRFNRSVVLEITGNYYVAYSAAALTPTERARKTFLDVMLPLLRVAVTHVDRTVPFDAYGFEVAHHVRAKVMKVDTEGPENLVVVIPRGVAERLVKATDVETQQAALLESDVFLNSEPLTLWLTGGEAPADVKDHYLARRKGEKPADTDNTLMEPGTLVSPHLIPDSEFAKRIRDYSKTSHEVPPAKLDQLQTNYAATVQRLLADLKTPAHFVDYAPPAFIAFHDGAFLQLNVITDLDEPAGSSRYLIAALAFDNHIAHLLRPVSKYFHTSPQFEGIDFSTTIHQAGQPNSESVEFVVPFQALLCYEKYDCTGQELINRSIILINGERAALDLQKAESDFSGSR
ncbi:MAG TPA: hypothetical protein VKE93_07170 [Candidatus Angelobacter sp.]|nr:hypothetical protein [Candidatus Angelobacter sp.]